eukprot:5117139-Pleurochrysis_carterae.AAC.6
MAANGRIAYKALESLVGEIAHETANVRGKHISAFSSPQQRMRLFIQLDAARRCTRQFFAVVVKNPQLHSQSCFALRLFALGVRSKDDRHGARQLLASNLPYIENLLVANTALVPSISGDSSLPLISIALELLFCGEFAGVRAIEGVVCYCPSDAMHAVPTPSQLSTLSAHRSSVLQCDYQSTFAQRTARAHQPQPSGEIHACDCCDFALERMEVDAFEKRLAALRAGNTQEGK